MASEFNPTKFSSVILNAPPTEFDRTYYPGIVPSSQIIWPADRHQSNQIQQIKGSAKPLTAFVLPTTQPSSSSVAPRTTPQYVGKVRVVTRQPIPSDHKRFTIQFRHPGGDPYFAGVNVYLRQSGQQPVLVGGGAKSPVTITVPVAAAVKYVPHTIIVTSVGNWGETDVLKSPSYPVSLR